MAISVHNFKQKPGTSLPSFFRTLLKAAAPRQREDADPPAAPDREAKSHKLTCQCSSTCESL
jgi:hypothetical protein